MLPKLVFTDIDGVWTDGGMFYDQTGNEWKLFNTNDSAGVNFLKELNIDTIILTGEDTQIVARRAQKLGIEVHQGVKKKLSLANAICKERGIELSECGYIGDDLADLPLLRAVGVSGAPSNACIQVKEEVGISTETPGGKGAFREFIETILTQAGKMDEVVEKILNKLES